MECNAMQVNNGFRAQPHVDSANKGPSWTCSVGAFTGGMLWKEDSSGSSQCLRPQLGGGLAHLAGCKLRGRMVDTRHAWTCVAEQQIHAVTEEEQPSSLLSV